MVGTTKSITSVKTPEKTLFFDLFLIRKFLEKYEGIDGGPYLHLTAPYIGVYEMYFSFLPPMLPPKLNAYGMKIRGELPP